MPATQEDIDRIMNAKNHYEVLGIKQDATLQEINKAYRKFALMTHPDQNPGINTTQAMAKINEAGEVLRDQDKRQKYDVSLEFANAPRAEAPKQKMSLGEKFVNALKSFCEAVSSFFKSFTSKQEQKQEHQGPKNN
ncbi:TPA: DnaJ domain-containing protein [Legionella pneumophila]|uniref:J domain-containing protein n=1 Tax=Legionella pneumophila TaxID=446 RepID=UPI0007779EF8|nr:J domain-containing protein [Legionella pneumophila]MCW8476140.1 J domain-containing protein [Legionella pneumophila]